MLTSMDFYKKYGHPSKKKNLILWDVPFELEIGVIPRRIYCNSDMVKPLTEAFSNLILTNAVSSLKTWDGCWNFRPIRGYEKKYESLMNANKQEEAIKYLSTHSWACAIDVNAAENGLGKLPKLSRQFVKCFTDAGFEWGGLWKRPDGMHFQLASI